MSWLIAYVRLCRTVAETAAFALEQLEVLLSDPWACLPTAEDARAVIEWLQSDELAAELGL